MKTKVIGYIDASQQSENCYPLTVNKPNALMRILNKTLLEYSVERISKDCEVIYILIRKKHHELFQSIQLPLGCTIIDERDVIDNVNKNTILELDASFFYPPLQSISLSDKHEIKYSWELLNLQEQYSFLIKPDHKDAIIESNVTIKGEVNIGKGSILKSGVYIEGSVTIGENCTIGPNCYIRGTTSLGDGCRIGNAVEIKNSIIGNNVNICHLSYLGDSIVGDNVNLGAGFINANLRHDHCEIITALDGLKINTRRKKLGAIIGDGVHTGINTSVYPGRKIWTGMNTNPGTIVEKDILE